MIGEHRRPDHVIQADLDGAIDQLDLKALTIEWLGVFYDAKTEGIWDGRYISDEDVDEFVSMLRERLHNISI